VDVHLGNLVDCNPLLGLLPCSETSEVALPNLIELKISAGLASFDTILSMLQELLRDRAMRGCGRLQLLEIDDNSWMEKILQAHAAETIDKLTPLVRTLLLKSWTKDIVDIEQ
jgi:hypothetical protein